MNCDERPLVRCPWELFNKLATLNELAVGVEFVLQSLKMATLVEPVKIIGNVKCDGAILGGNEIDDVWLVDRHITSPSNA